MWLLFWVWKLWWLLLLELALLAAVGMILLKQ